MKPWFMQRGVCLVVVVAACALPAEAQVQDRPIITEVYNNPPGLKDGPVGRDPANAHQEYIEIYLPPCADLAPGFGFNCDAINLTFYEVEGDSSSSGVELMNYRFDLPTFDVNSNNGLQGPALPRPQSGIVVLGWVDYAAGDPPMDLAGMPATRVGLINGGITANPAAPDDYTFVAINGHHFTGTTNLDFLPVGAESLIDVSTVPGSPKEESSGVIQNGSGVYLLVNRDAVGYVKLCDDKHAGDCVDGADPVLPNDALGLSSTSLLDGFAGNNEGTYDPTKQPPKVCSSMNPANCDDLQTMLPLGSAFSLLIPQLSIKDKTRATPATGSGFARVYINGAKTTEDPGVTNDPVADTFNAYRLIRDNGPFFPTPGKAPKTTSAPELGLGLAVEQHYQVLTQTVGRPGLLAANVGGSFAIDLSSSGGTSTNSSVATFAPGLPALNVPGQSFGFPSVAVTPAVGAVSGSASANVTVTATNSGGGPAVLNSSQDVDVTVTIIDPTTGLDVNLATFQATVFVAIQPVFEDPAVLNEFLLTDVGAFLAAQPAITLLETVGNGALLLNAATNLADPNVNLGRIAELPVLGEECLNWLNPPGPVGKLDLVQTVVQSAEVLTLNNKTYIDSLALNIPQGMICTLDSTSNAGLPCALNSQCNGGNNNNPGICVDCTGILNAVQAKSFNHPDITTFGGSFTPSELVYFADDQGVVGNPRSGLSNATTTRTFELLLVDTNQSQFASSRESGLTDDFGIIFEVLETEAGSPVVPGEFVFASFTGGLQGADIDPQVGNLGDVLLQLIFLDLDNLHTKLKIKSIERIFVVDGSGTSQLDLLDVFSLNPVTVGGGVAVTPVPANELGDVCITDTAGLPSAECTGLALGAPCNSGVCVRPKHRYLSFDPRPNGSTAAALQVTLPDGITKKYVGPRVPGDVVLPTRDALNLYPLVNTFAEATLQLWRNTCSQQSANQGAPCTGDLNCVGGTCEPGNIHVGDCRVVPTQRICSPASTNPGALCNSDSACVNGSCIADPNFFYEVRSTTDGIAFTAPLVVRTVATPVDTRLYGDITGSKTNTNWRPSDGIVNANDIGVMVAKVELDPETPHLSTFELANKGGFAPGFSISAADLNAIVAAFEINPYANPTDPALCP